MDLGLKTETFNPAEDHRWLGSKHAANTAKTITLDASAFDAISSFTDGVIPSGVVLGKITASGLYGPYDDGATDGREDAVGHLFTTVDTKEFTVDSPAALLWHGSVIVDNLPADHGLDAAAAADLSQVHYTGDVPA